MDKAVSSSNVLEMFSSSTLGEVRGSEKAPSALDNCESLPLTVEKRADGQHEARFAFQLDSCVQLELSFGAGPTYEAFVLEHVFAALGVGQSLKFACRREAAARGRPGVVLRIGGCAAAQADHTAKRAAQELGEVLRRLLGGRADLSFAAVVPDTLPFAAAWRVDTEGILITPHAKPTALDRSRLSVILPALSMVEARVPFWEALLACEFVVEAIVTVTPVAFERQAMNAMAGALDVLEDSHPRVEMLPGRRWISRAQVEALEPAIAPELRRWLRLPAGVHLQIELRTERAIPAGALRALAQTLLPNRRITLVPVQEAASDEAYSNAVDLRNCFNESRAMPALLPTADALARMGLPLSFPRPTVSMAMEGIVLGETWGEKVRLPALDRERHCYIVGATGTGKSNLLCNSISQDIANGEGVCLIESHGDLYRDIKARIPPHRARDVILFDPTDFERAPGLNYLEIRGEHPGIERNFVTNEMIRIFDRLYDMKVTGGPIFEQYMRNALLLLMESRIPGLTLLEINALFEDGDFRHYLMRNCTNPGVIRFWSNQAERAGGEAALQNIVPYITSKVNQFTSNALTRNIVGQSKSTIDFRAAMDQRRILLINLSKGMLGESDSALLGMLIVSKLFAAALGRARMAREARHPFYLYIDEFQNYTTATSAHLLSEARKFSLSLILANQHLTQLKTGSGPDNILSAVLGNVGSVLTMRLSPADEDALRELLGGNLPKGLLQNLPDYHVAARLIQNGRPAPAFVFKTVAPEETLSNRKAQRIIARAYLNEYTRAVDVVEKEIAERGEMGSKRDG